MKRTKLRTWVKILITIIVLLLILYFHNVAMYKNIDINYKIIHWFILIPLSFCGLSLLWED